MQNISNFKRGLIFLALLFFSSSLFSNQISLNKEYQKRYWLLLLHFRDGKSEIDDKKFFLAPNGKYNPKAEMLATIKALKKNDKIWCKYPARATYLAKKFPLLNIKKPKCPKLDRTLRELNANYASLIFPTAHINSPASMYGHTFLRIDSNLSTPLISNAVNYAAKTEETNGFIFAYQGIFGGYEGRYSILPYYDKIKEYSSLERRDIWEYRLNLTKNEIKKMVLHIYEVHDTYSNYFFFKENCSYNLLWFLEIARPKTFLVNKFDYKAIPLDTIRVAKKAGFIIDVIYRPSKTKKIQYIMNKIEDKKLALKFLENYNFALLKDLEKKQKIYILDLAIEMLEFKRVKNKISKKLYIKSLLKILKKRSRLGRIAKHKTQTPNKPLSGHKSSKFSITFKNFNNSLDIEYKPAFHDIYDVETGYVNGAYISFFDLKFNLKDNLKLEKFSFINLESYSKRDLIFKPTSWKVSFGVERKFDELYTNLNLGAGFTYGKDEDWFIYLMTTPSFYYKDKGLAKIGANIGFIKNFDNLKIGVEGERNFYSNSFDELLFESFITYKIANSTSLNLKYEYQKLEISKKSVNFGIFYYF